MSNHHRHHLEAILSAGTIVPALNQIELSPRLQQRELRKVDEAHGIVTESWSPLGGSKHSVLDDETIVSIAQKHGKTPAQTVVRWHLQQGLVVIPKSVHEDRIKENIDVFDFELDADDLAAFAALDAGERSGPNPDDVE